LNRHNTRKYKECDLRSLLGRDATTEDICTGRRLSAQQRVSFDPRAKSNAMFITSIFFCNGKYYDVANLSSWLKGWSRRGSVKGNTHMLANEREKSFW